MNYSPKAFLSKEPAAIASALVAVANALVLFGVVDLTEDQLAAGNVALVALLGLFVRQNVTPAR